MLGEASTTKIARKKDAQGFTENKDAAIKGGMLQELLRINLKKKQMKKSLHLIIILMSLNL